MIRHDYICQKLLRKNCCYIVTKMHVYDSNMILESNSKGINHTEIFELSFIPMNIKSVKICYAPMDHLFNGIIIVFSRLLPNYSYLFKPQCFLILRHKESIRLGHLFLYCVHSSYKQMYL